MYLSQKIMMKANAQADLDPAQQAMQKSMSKIMPVMIIGMFVFIPIPAGVFLYMITSNIIQIVQTVIIDKQLKLEDQATKKDVIEAEVIDKDKK
jgi:YidC/Oxa1 family membrane protein insertase